MCRFLAPLALAASLALAADVALACPTCKDQLAHDPQSANVARGYAMSIIFMLSMPPLIFAGLGSYFYWEVRKARAAMSGSLSRETSDESTAGSPKSHDFGYGYPAT
ncbi:MAG: hypothetical protein WEH44_09180 [Pirellulaceae bacterium]